MHFKIYEQGGAAFQPVPGPGKCQWWKVAAIKEVLHKKRIPTKRLYGLGTDGAAVMTGMNSQHNKVEYSLGFLTWISYGMYVLIFVLFLKQGGWMV